VKLQATAAAAATVARSARIDKLVRCCGRSSSLSAGSSDDSFTTGDQDDVISDSGETVGGALVLLTGGLQDPELGGRGADGSGAGPVLLTGGVQDVACRRRLLRSKMRAAKDFELTHRVQSQPATPAVLPVADLQRSTDGADGLPSASSPRTAWPVDGARGRWFRVDAKAVSARRKPHVDAARVGPELLSGDVFRALSSVLSEDGFIYLELPHGRGWVFNDRRVRPVRVVEDDDGLLSSPRHIVEARLGCKAEPVSQPTSARCRPDKEGPKYACPTCGKLYFVVDSDKFCGGCGRLRVGAGEVSSQCSSSGMTSEMQPTTTSEHGQERPAGASHDDQSQNSQSQFSIVEREPDTAGRPPVPRLVLHTQPIPHAGQQQLEVRPTVPPLSATASSASPQFSTRSYFEHVGPIGTAQSYLEQQHDSPTRLAPALSGGSGRATPAAGAAGCSWSHVARTSAPQRGDGPVSGTPTGLMQALSEALRGGAFGGSGGKQIAANWRRDGVQSCFEMHFPQDHHLASPAAAGGVGAVSVPNPASWHSGGWSSLPCSARTRFEQHRDASGAPTPANPSAALWRPPLTNSAAVAAQQPHAAGGGVRLSSAFLAAMRGQAAPLTPRRAPAPAAAASTSASAAPAPKVQGELSPPCPQASAAAQRLRASAGAQQPLCFDCVVLGGAGPGPAPRLRT